LFEGGFEVIDDFLGEDITDRGGCRIVRTFVYEPEDVEAGFVAIMK